MELGDRGDLLKWKKAGGVEETVAIPEKISKKLNYDLNNDGVVDKKDMSIAGKTLVSGAKNAFKKKKK